MMYPTSKQRENSLLLNVLLVLIFVAIIATTLMTFARAGRAQKVIVCVAQQAPLKVLPARREPFKVVCVVRVVDR